MLPAFINFVILLIISAIHFFWSFGGTWGLRAALPERNGAKAFQPGRFITFAVAIIFGGMALFYLVLTGQFQFTLIGSGMPDWFTYSGLWLLAGIFLLRAIGEFQYVGFFKRVRNSRFAELDTKFYSPLCLFLSLNTFLLISFLS